MLYICHLDKIMQCFHGTFFDKREQICSVMVTGKIKVDNTLVDN